LAEKVSFDVLINKIGYVQPFLL